MCCATGSVVVRFVEDGSRYWFPLAEVKRFLEDMQSKGRDAASGTIGQGSHAFAAQVLAGTLAAKKKASGMTSSSATAGAAMTSKPLPPLRPLSAVSPQPACSCLPCLPSPLSLSVPSLQP